MKKGIAFWCNVIALIAGLAVLIGVIVIQYGASGYVERQLEINKHIAICDNALSVRQNGLEVIDKINPLLERERSVDGLRCARQLRSNIFEAGREAEQYKQKLLDVKNSGMAMSRIKWAIVRKDKAAIRLGIVSDAADTMGVILLKIYFINARTQNCKLPEQLISSFNEMKEFDTVMEEIDTGIREINKMYNELDG